NQVLSPHSGNCLNSRIASSNFNSGIFRWLVAMIFAIVEVNNDPLLLPNVTLGYMIYEACFNTHKAVKATISFIGSEIAQMQENICKPRAIIGSESSSFSSIVAHFLGPFYIPQVSYISTCKCLSDKKEYPSFLRTVPSDAFQATAMARIISHFHWVFLGALQDDDDYGKQGIAQFVKEAENKGHCLDFIETIPNVDEVDKINLLASVIVVFSAERRFSPFVEELWKRNITGKIWIASEAWATFKPYTSQRFSHIFQGSIGFALRHGSIPGFYEFLVTLRPFIKNALCKCNKDIHQNRFETSRQKTKRTIFNSANVTRSKCKSGSSFLSTCTGLEELRNIETQFTDVSHMIVTYHTYIATYALAHALHDLQQCVPGQGPWDNGTCAAITNFQSWQVTRKPTTFLNALCIFIVVT
uniref:Receptor ligand binding region domain-containing protein n=1 Tax=Eptatretus burgeri TaxID=7764 RepID=A0A8C4RC62_EPTBU